MSRKIQLIFALTFITNFNLLFAQDFQILNNLPPTIEVRAPEFNISKIYYFKVDTLNNNLIIQDLRSSKQGDIHFYQWLYEIPLNTLNKESFKVSKGFDNELQLEISSKNNLILSYMFQNGKVVSINGINKIVLGDWNYSTTFSSLLEENVKTVSSNLPINSSNAEKLEKFSQKFKFIGENVQAINAKIDTDLTIGNGYYLGQMEDVKFNRNKLKNALKEKNISYSTPLPIIIYADKNGNIESIFVHAKPYEKDVQIDLSNFKALKPLIFEKNNVPAKYIFLL